MLSPLLFFILIDYVVRITNLGSRGYIMWGIFSFWNIWMILTTPMNWLSWHALILRFEIRLIMYGRLKAVSG